MATAQSTTPTRRPRKFPLSLVSDPLPATQPEDNLPAPLFLRDGEEFREAPESTVVDHACRLISAHFRPGAPVMTDPTVLHQFLTLHLAPLEHEIFAMILMDAQRRLIDYVELFRGTVDGSSIYPREVIKLALAKNADSVMLVHNHPSGCSEPSLADRTVTQRLKAAFALVEVRFVDHIIVGKQITSMRDRGMI